MSFAPSQSAAAELTVAQSMLRTGRVAQAWLAAAPLRRSIDHSAPQLRAFAGIAIAAGQVDAAVDALARAAILEGNPPDLIGGIADLYELVGRFDELLPYWRQLVALRPDLSDAHLNLAITAGKAGRHDDAIAAADAGLKRFALHPRLLAVRAMALKNAGRIDEALASFDQAIAVDPNRALTRHNHAVTLRAALRFDDACAAFATAAKLGLAGSEFHSNWAAASLEAGQIAQADTLYRRALREDPSNQQALRGLTRLEIEFHERDGFDHYETSCDARGSSVEAWIDWIGALSANYRLEKAVEVGRRSLRRHPGEPTLRALTAFAEGMSGDAAAALDVFASLPREVVASPTTLISRAQLALRAGDPALASSLAEDFTRFQPQSQLGWAILSLAWRVAGDPREAWLCDYERLVMVTDVPSTDGIDAPHYASLVGDILEPLHRSRAAPGNQSLRGGTQTSGALFDLRDPQIVRFRDAVLAAAERMTARLPFDPGHPFLSRRSATLGFTGSWSVRLRPGNGHHVPHFHSQGWMSSAYYARLPVADAKVGTSRQGWIQFGVPPSMYGLDLPPRRMVQPLPGRLVLFPSYLWHGTVPFDQGDRLTAAFDFVPR